MVGFDCDGGHLVGGIVSFSIGTISIIFQQLFSLLLLILHRRFSEFVILVFSSTLLLVILYRLDGQPKNPSDLQVYRDVWSFSE